MTKNTPLRLVQVRLLKGIQQDFTYSVPHDWELTTLVGSLVEVPLRNKKVPALIRQLLPADTELPTFTVKSLLKSYQFPRDPFYASFLEKASDYYCLESIYWYKRLRSFLGSEEKNRDTFELSVTDTPEKKVVQLTPTQAQVVATLIDLMAKRDYAPALLHGVTGSGKTEIYKKLIEQAILQEKKAVMLLLPEVSLAVQFAQLLRSQLNQAVSVFSFHSAISSKEKKALWQALLAQQPVLIIGVHLPILLPLGNLGLIIVDEEHEQGFQEKKYPKLNTKELALLRAQITKIPIVLGSATPSLTTLYTAKTRNWPLLTLHERFSGAFPVSKVVLLTNKEKRNSFWITKELEAAITDRLAKKEQVIIFINRRGYSFFVQCGDCGFVETCSNCAVSLTLHEEGLLRCHYCGFTKQAPRDCSSCKAPEKKLLKKGIGTQQIVAILTKLFPLARIARADLDSTVNKKKWQQTVTSFFTGESDILVGTQTITKGYHFPKVTLVGVIWADCNLSIPFYNAAEQTLQQLIQVAGRAGRQSKESLVIIQSMAEHAFFEYIDEKKYLEYYAHELENRHMAGYPPCMRLAEIEVCNRSEQEVVQDSNQLADFLFSFSPGVRVLGPAVPPVAKIKHIYTRKIYLKAASMGTLITAWRLVKKNYTGGSSVSFTPQPVN
jgi:primosomal protein N' (replication factor Y)